MQCPFKQRVCMNNYFEEQMYIKLSDQQAYRSTFVDHTFRSFVQLTIAYRTFVDHLKNVADSTFVRRPVVQIERSSCRA